LEFDVVAAVTTKLSTRDVTSAKSEAIFFSNIMNLIIEERHILFK
jgi:hypothetical protein